jgi:anti-sigma28 factor (negative regulator of flagellin synthesis)
MEINSLSSYPTGPERRNKPATSSPSTSAPQSDSFSGPNIEAKKQQLSEIDGIRLEKVEELQKKIQSGDYFTEDKIIKTVEALLSGL